MIFGQRGSDNRPKVLLEFSDKSLSRVQRGKKSSALRIPKTANTRDRGGWQQHGTGARAVRT